MSTDCHSHVSTYCHYIQTGTNFSDKENLATDFHSHVSTYCHYIQTGTDFSDKENLATDFSMHFTDSWAKLYEDHLPANTLADGFNLWFFRPTRRLEKCRTPTIGILRS